MFATITNQRRLPASPRGLVLRSANTAAEISLLRQALRQHHYLKDGRAVGHVLWQGIYRQPDQDGGTPELLAVLCWGAAAWRLKDRDDWIGWDNLTRANRLKLIVQLRRFCLVRRDQASPNLASQCLGLALRTLSGQWQERFGYKPLLAESFHDPQHHRGTLYQVTNWTPLGFTKGTQRHRRDFYQDIQSPKHLWIRPLQKNAQALLGRPGELPAAHQAAVSETVAGARSALNCRSFRSLRDAFRHIDDHRDARGRKHPISAMLTLVAYGLLCGAPDVKTIWRKCGPLTQHHRRAIGLTHRDDQSGRLKLPGYHALNNFINGLDPIKLAHGLTGWLQAHQDTLPKTLAFDGKDLGSKGKLGQIVTLCLQATGAPVALRSYSGDKNDSEQPTTRRMLNQEHMNLTGTLITGDALNTQKKRHSSSGAKAGTTAWR
jgi:hypothetical protein